jgi:hypothetical protein
MVVVEILFIHSAGLVSKEVHVFPAALCSLLPQESDD